MYNDIITTKQRISKKNKAISLILTSLKSKSSLKRKLTSKPSSQTNISSINARLIAGFNHRSSLCSDVRKSSNIGQISHYIKVFGL